MFSQAQALRNDSIGRVVQLTGRFLAERAQVHGKSGEDLRRAVVKLSCNAPAFLVLQLQQFCRKIAQRLFRMLALRDVLVDGENADLLAVHESSIFSLTPCRAMNRLS